MHCSKVEELLTKMQENNQMFSEEQVELLQNITGTQHPKITLLTCSDSRVDMNYFKMNSLDKIFTVRNLGNAILTSEGSIDYGVKNLNTPILFIIGHTNCGAIHSALNNYHNCSTDIQRELNNIAPSLINLKKKDDKGKWVEAVENNLELQLKIAENKFKRKLEKGNFTIIGAILDIDNSYGEGIGKIHIKNIIGTHECDFDIEY